MVESHLPFNLHTDAENRMLEMVDSEQGVFKFTYDANGNLLTDNRCNYGQSNKVETEALGKTEPNLIQGIRTPRSMKPSQTNNS